jgi:hypothetical protein
MVAPPLLVQLANEANAWVPSTLVDVLSGVEAEVASADRVGVPAAILALCAWALVPAILGLLSIHRRDVA